MDKTKNGFDRMPEAKLLAEARSIVTKCTGNTNFPTLQATVTLVDTATTAYGEALDAASGGDRTAVAVKNQKRDELINLLRQLGVMISGVANGDLAMLASSGYPIAGKAEPTAPLTKPNPPVLKPGFVPGQVLSIGSSVKNAKAVFHMVTPDPVTANSEWASYGNTRRRYTYNNLESGKRYWFKQAQIGVRSQYVESDAISFVTQ